MRPDKQIIEDEARQQVKLALASYPEPSHVLLYAAFDLLEHHPNVDHGWNALQERADMPAEDLADVLIRVDEHLNDGIEGYMHE